MPCAEQTDETQAYYNGRLLWGQGLQPLGDFVVLRQK